MFPFKVLEEKFRTIPENVREAILSTEVSEKLEAIVTKYKLQLDEGEELTKEIGYVMLGLKNPDYFVRNVQNATALDKATAEKIVADVNEQIFKEIKESLKEIHSNKDTLEEDIDTADLNEEIQEKMREELLQEIEKGDTQVEPTVTETTEPAIETETDLALPPEQDLQIIPQTEVVKVPESTKPTEPTTPPPTVTPTSTDNPEQNKEKKYIMDPYREPIE